MGKSAMIRARTRTETKRKGRKLYFSKDSIASIKVGKFKTQLMWANEETVEAVEAASKWRGMILLNLEAG